MRSASSLFVTNKKSQVDMSDLPYHLCHFSSQHGNGAAIPRGGVGGKKGQELWAPRPCWPLLPILMQQLSIKSCQKGSKLLVSVSTNTI